MYAMAKSAREALKNKARRLATETVGKVDATSVDRPKAFEAEKKAGLQPTTRRAYKKGGRVGKEGGGTLPSPQEAVASEARQKSIRVEDKRALPSAAEAASRSGKTPQDVPGRKKGGSVKRKGKDLGGIAEVLSPAYAAIRALQRNGKDEERDAAEQAKGMAMANAMRKKGGKVAKRDGRKNGGVTVINIGKGNNDPQAPVAAPRPMPMPMPAAPPPPMNSQMPVMQPPVPPGPGAPQKPPLALKTGGRATKVAKSYKDMRAGSGSGEGRLQKTDIAKKRA